ncbi:MAG: hypothetical protein D6683_04995 [Actinomyces sp.]|nr:MAG: hypothetical protein D6683_04995 [Actinomyces sp.]
MMSAIDQTADCRDRTDAEWHDTTIRGSSGCEFQNAAGIYFAAWAADGTAYLFSSREVAGEAALAYLSAWTPLETS